MCFGPVEADYAFEYQTPEAFSSALNNPLISQSSCNSWLAAASALQVSPVVSLDIFSWENSPSSSNGSLGNSAAIAGPQPAAQGITWMEWKPPSCSPATLNEYVATLAGVVGRHCTSFQCDPHTTAAQLLVWLGGLKAAGSWAGLSELQQLPGEVLAQLSGALCELQQQWQQQQSVTALAAMALFVELPPQQPARFQPGLVGLPASGDWCGVVCKPGSSSSISAHVKDLLQQSSRVMVLQPPDPVMLLEAALKGLGLRSCPAAAKLVISCIQQGRGYLMQGSSGSWKSAQMAALTMGVGLLQRLVRWVEGRWVPVWKQLQKQQQQPAQLERLRQQGQTEERQLRGKGKHKKQPATTEQQQHEQLLLVYESAVYAMVHAVEEVLFPSTEPLLAQACKQSLHDNAQLTGSWDPTIAAQVAGMQPVLATAHPGSATSAIKEGTTGASWLQMWTPEDIGAAAGLVLQQQQQEGKIIEEQGQQQQEASTSWADMPVLQADTAAGGVSDLHSSLQLAGGCLLLGPGGVGKSLLLQLLVRSYNQLQRAASSAGPALTTETAAAAAGMAMDRAEPAGGQPGSISLVRLYPDTWAEDAASTGGFGDTVINQKNHLGKKLSAAAVAVSGSRDWLGQLQHHCLAALTQQGSSTWNECDHSCTSIAAGEGPVGNPEGAAGQQRTTCSCKGTCEAASVCPWLLVLDGSIANGSVTACLAQQLLQPPPGFGSWEAVLQQLLPGCIGVVVEADEQNEGLLQQAADPLSDVALQDRQVGDAILASEALLAMLPSVVLRSPLIDLRLHVAMRLREVLRPLPALPASGPSCNCPATSVSSSSSGLSGERSPREEAISSQEGQRGGNSSSTTIQLSSALLSSLAALLLDLLAAAAALCDPTGTGKQQQQQHSPEVNVSILGGDCQDADVAEHILAVVASMWSSSTPATAAVAEVLSARILVFCAVWVLAGRCREGAEVQQLGNTLKGVVLGAGFSHAVPSQGGIFGSRVCLCCGGWRPWRQEVAEGDNSRHSSGPSDSSSSTKDASYPRSRMGFGFPSTGAHMCVSERVAAMECVLWWWLAAGLNPIVMGPKGSGKSTSLQELLNQAAAASAASVAAYSATMGEIALLSSCGQGASAASAAGSFRVGAGHEFRLSPDHLSRGSRTRDLYRLVASEKDFGSLVTGSTSSSSLPVAGCPGLGSLKHLLLLEDLQALGAAYSCNMLKKGAADGGYGGSTCGSYSSKVLRNPWFEALRQCLDHVTPCANASSIGSAAAAAGCSINSSRPAGHKLGQVLAIADTDYRGVSIVGGLDVTRRVEGWVRGYRHFTQMHIACFSQLSDAAPRPTGYSPSNSDSSRSRSSAASREAEKTGVRSGLHVVPPGAQCFALVARSDALAAAVETVVEKLPAVQGISKPRLGCVLQLIYYSIAANLQELPRNCCSERVQGVVPLKLYCQSLQAAVQLLLSWQQPPGAEGQCQQLSMPCPAQLRAWVTLGELALVITDCLGSLWLGRLGVDDEVQQLLVRMVVLVVAHYLTQAAECQQNQQQQLQHMGQAQQQKKQTQHGELATIESSLEHQQQQQLQGDFSALASALASHAVATEGTLSPTTTSNSNNHGKEILKLTQQQWQELMNASDAVLVKQLLPQWLQHSKCLSRRVLQQLLLVGSYGMDPVHYWEGLHVGVARQELEELIIAEAAGVKATAAPPSEAAGLAAMAAAGEGGMLNTFTCSRPTMQPAELQVCHSMLGSSSWVAAVHRVMAAMSGAVPLQQPAASGGGSGSVALAPEQEVYSSCVVLSGAPETCLEATAALAATAMGSCVVRLGGRITCKELVAAVASQQQQVANAAALSVGNRCKTAQSEILGFSGWGGVPEKCQLVMEEAPVAAQAIRSVTVVLGAAACEDDAVCDLLQRSAMQGWVTAAEPDWEPRVDTSAAGSCVVTVPEWPAEINFLLFPSPQRLNELHSSFPGLMEVTGHVPVPRVPAAARLADDLAAVATRQGSSGREVLEHHCLQDAPTAAAASASAVLPRVGSQAAKEAALMAAVARSLGEALVKLTGGGVRNSVAEPEFNGKQAEVGKPKEQNRAAAVAAVQAGRGTVEVPPYGAASAACQPASAASCRFRIGSSCSSIWPLLHQLLQLVVHCHGTARPPLVCRKRRLTAAIQQVKLNLKALEEQQAGELQEERGQQQQGNVGWDSVGVKPCCVASQLQQQEQEQQEGEQRPGEWLTQRLGRLKEQWEVELQQVDQQLQCLLGDCMIAAAEATLIPRLRGRAEVCGVGGGVCSGVDAGGVKVSAAASKATHSIAAEAVLSANRAAWVQLIEQEGGFPVSQFQPKQCSVSAGEEKGPEQYPELLPQLLGLSLEAEQLKAARVLGLYPGSAQHLLSSWAVAAAADKPVLLLDPYQQLLPVLLPLNRQHLDSLQSGLLQQEWEEVKVDTSSRSSTWIITNTAPGGDDGGGGRSLARQAAENSVSVHSQFRLPARMLGSLLKPIDATAAAAGADAVVGGGGGSGGRREGVGRMVRALASGHNVLLQLSGDWAADEPLVEELVGRHWVMMQNQCQQQQQKQQDKGRAAVREGGSRAGLSSAGTRAWSSDAGKSSENRQQQHKQQQEEEGPEGGEADRREREDKESDDDEFSGWGGVAAKRTRGPSMIGLRLSLAGGVLSLSGAAAGVARHSSISSAATTLAGSSAGGAAAAIAPAKLGQLLLVAPAEMQLAQLGPRAHELCSVISTLEQGFTKGPAAAVATGIGGSCSHAVGQEAVLTARSGADRDDGEGLQKAEEQQEGEDKGEQHKWAGLPHPLLLEWSLQQVLSALAPAAVAKAVAAALAGAEEARAELKREEDTVLQRLSQVRGEEMQFGRMARWLYRTENWAAWCKMAWCRMSQGDYCCASPAHDPAVS